MLIQQLLPTSTWLIEALEACPVERLQFSNFLGIMAGQWEVSTRCGTGVSGRVLFFFLKNVDLPGRGAHFPFSPLPLSCLKLDG